jgi:hypothetical protein
MSSAEAVFSARSLPHPGPIRRLLGLLLFVGLGYLAIRFYLRDPLHYLIDHSEASFGRFWPRRAWLVFHILGGTLALIAGPFQFWSGLGRRYLLVHKTSGRLYLLGVLMGGAAAFYMSLFTQPRDFGVALFVLAAVWWVTGTMAFLAVMRRRIEAHRQWVTRSYVLTFAFVSFRWLVDLPALQTLGDSRFATATWLSWVVPLLVIELALQWKQTFGSAEVSAARAQTT